MANSDVLLKKRMVIDEIKDKTKKSPFVLVWEYKTTDVKSIIDIKNKLNDFGATSKVYKNTLAKIAFEELSYKDIIPHLSGQNAISFSSTEDEIANARIIHSNIEKNKNIKLKAGIFEGKVITGDDLNTIATLPSREGLISIFASMLQTNIRNFAYALSQISKD